MAFRALPRCLAELEALENYRSRLALVAACQEAIMGLIPSAWRADVRLGWLEDGVVWLEVPQGALAAKLRQMSSRILASLPMAPVPWRELKVHVRPALTHQGTGASPLAPSVLRDFGALAERLPDGPLRRAVESLLKERR